MNNGYKKFKIDIQSLSAIEIYEMVLSGQLKRFPSNFWKDDFVLDYAKEIGEYIIDKHFNNSDEYIKERYGVKFINEIRLHSVLKLFGFCAFKYLDFLYPNRFKVWEFKSTPQKYWDFENAVLATKWLIEDKLKWDLEQIKNLLNYKIFSQNGLTGMLTQVFNHSVFTAIDAAYPNTYKPWDLKNVPIGYWKNPDNVRQALEWLFQEKLNWKASDIKKYLTIDFLIREGFSGLLRWYKGIPYDIIYEIYPDLHREPSHQ